MQMSPSLLRFHPSGQVVSDRMTLDRLALAPFGWPGANLVATTHPEGSELGIR
jgi:hypothetical protein